MALQTLPEVDSSAFPSGYKPTHAGGRLNN